jgi:hypothetical protein
MFAAAEIPGEQAQSVTIQHGDLKATFSDNSLSPNIALSGVASLFNIKAAPDYNAYDPDDGRASAGINFEHIISGHKNPNNSFTPRSGKYALYRLPDGKSVLWRRGAEDEPWGLESTTRITMTAPHYLDIEFRCKAQDARPFGSRGYAITFWANYMNDVSDIPLHFRGIGEPGGEEKWIAGDGPEGPRDWNQGGTYRNAEAGDLRYDEDHNFTLNSWSYDYPRYTKPFYYGLAGHGMVYMLMFDKAYSADDEIRFSIFKFKLKKHPRPAWDYQYVIHKIEAGREYGYRARVVWKRFASADDCLAEYEHWVRSRTSK